MRVTITCLLFCISTVVFTQNLILESAFKIDQTLVGLDYIFGDAPESVFYFTHTEQLNAPVSNHAPMDGLDASFYLVDEGEPFFSFSLDSGTDSILVHATGSNESISVDYLYFKCGSNVKAIDEDQEIIFELDLKDSTNNVLLQVGNTDEILVSYLDAPENSVSKIIAMENSTLISGSFKDTLTYTDPEGEVHKYFTNDVYNGFLLSLDENGKPMWIHTSRAVGFSIVRSVSVSNVIAYAHDVIFGTQLDILNLNGDTISTQYLNNVSIMHIEAFEDNSIAMCGNYYRTNNVPDMDLGAGELILPDPIVKDAFVIKYDEDFNVIWYDVIGGDAIDTATKFDFDEEGGLYLTGCIQADGIFNGGNEVYIAQGLEDIFLTYYSPEGDYNWTRVWGGDGTDIGLNIHVEDNLINLSGVFRQTMDIDLSEDSDFFITDDVDAIDEAFFYTVYSLEAPSSVAEDLGYGFEVYPNPFSNSIQFNKTLSNVKVYTLTGRLLYTSDQASELNLDFIPEGSYLLNGTSSTGEVISRLISKMD